MSTNQHEKSAREQFGICTGQAVYNRPPSDVGPFVLLGFIGE